eukprot:scaffold2984_cov452-Prasinococcus_capsulatus_cf.AAC.11
MSHLGAVALYPVRAALRAATFYGKDSMESRRLRKRAPTRPRGEMPSCLFDMIDRTIILKELSRSCSEYIVSCMETLVFKRGDVVLEKHKESNCFYCIESGELLRRNTLGSPLGTPSRHCTLVVIANT